LQKYKDNQRNESAVLLVVNRHENWSTNVHK